jgi:hypothetical protein
MKGCDWLDPRPGNAIPGLKSRTREYGEEI